jgi:CubicO group peptidase (beta-lactamase class C family)
LVLVGLATSPRADPVDRYIKAQMQKRHIPGLAVAVVKDGKVVKTAAYGLADLENEAPVTVDSVFALASITKQFTAAAILLLVEEGKISLDDPVNGFLPDPPAAWKDITLRQLLTHTAGLASMARGFQSLQAAWPMELSTKDAYASAKKDPIDFAPGEAWQYSDVGYFLLGMVIEKVSGKKYAEFLAERIFRPLGMKSTSVPDPIHILKHRVRGYTLLNGNWVNIWREAQGELESHSGIFSTVGDLVRWDRALSTGRLLKPASLEQAYSPVVLKSGATYPYGFGWELGDRKGHRIVAHSGITGTEITRFLDDRLTVIVLTNLGNWGNPETAAANPFGMTSRIAAFYLPALEYRPIRDDHPDAAKQVRAVYENDLQPEPDPALWSPELLASVKASWPSIQSTVRARGPLQEAVLVDFRAQGRQQLFRYRVRFEKETRLVSMTLAEDGRIAAISSELFE